MTKAKRRFSKNKHKSEVIGLKNLIKFPIVVLDKLPFKTEKIFCNKEKIASDVSNYIDKKEPVRKSVLKNLRNESKKGKRRTSERKSLVNGTEIQKRITLPIVLVERLSIEDIKLYTRVKDQISISNECNKLDNNETQNKTRMIKEPINRKKHMKRLTTRKKLIPQPNLDHQLVVKHDYLAEKNSTTNKISVTKQEFIIDSTIKKNIQTVNKFLTKPKDERILCKNNCPIKQQFIENIEMVTKEKLKDLSTTKKQITNENFIGSTVNKQPHDIDDCFVETKTVVNHKSSSEKDNQILIENSNCSMEVQNTQVPIEKNSTDDSIKNQQSHIEESLIVSNVNKKIFDTNNYLIGKKIIVNTALFSEKNLTSESKKDKLLSIEEKLAKSIVDEQKIIDNNSLVKEKSIKIIQKFIKKKLADKLSEDQQIPIKKDVSKPVVNTQKDIAGCSGKNTTYVNSKLNIENDHTNKLIVDEPMLIKESLCEINGNISKNIADGCSEQYTIDVNNKVDLQKGQYNESIKNKILLTEETLNEPIVEDQIFVESNKCFVEKKNSQEPRKEQLVVDTIKDEKIPIESVANKQTNVVNNGFVERQSDKINQLPLEQKLIKQLNNTELIVTEKELLNASIVDNQKRIENNSLVKEKLIKVKQNSLNEDSLADELIKGEQMHIQQSLCESQLLFGSIVGKQKPIQNNCLVKEKLIEVTKNSVNKESLTNELIENEDSLSDSKLLAVSIVDDLELIENNSLIAETSIDIAQNSIYNTIEDLENELIQDEQMHTEESLNESELLTALITDERIIKNNSSVNENLIEIVSNIVNEDSLTSDLTENEQFQLYIEESLSESESLNGSIAGNEKHIGNNCVVKQKRIEVTQNSVNKDNLADELIENEDSLSDSKLLAASIIDDLELIENNSLVTETPIEITQNSISNTAEGHEDELIQHEKIQSEESLNMSELLAASIIDQRIIKNNSSINENRIEIAPNIVNEDSLTSDLTENEQFQLYTEERLSESESLNGSIAGNEKLIGNNCLVKSKPVGITSNSVNQECFPHDIIDEDQVHTEVSWSESELLTPSIIDKKLIEDNSLVRENLIEIARNLIISNKESLTNELIGNQQTQIQECGSESELLTESAVKNDKKLLVSNSLVKEKRIEITQNLVNEDSHTDEHIEETLNESEFLTATIVDDQKLTENNNLVKEKPIEIAQNSINNIESLTNEKDEQLQTHESGSKSELLTVSIADDQQKLIKNNCLVKEKLIKTTSNLEKKSLINKLIENKQMHVKESWSKVTANTQENVAGSCSAQNKIVVNKKLDLKVVHIDKSNREDSVCTEEFLALLTIDDHKFTENNNSVNTKTFIEKKFSDKLIISGQFNSVNDNIKQNLVESTVDVQTSLVGDNSIEKKSAINNELYCDETLEDKSMEHDLSLTEEDLSAKSTVDDQIEKDNRSVENKSNEMNESIQKNLAKEEHLSKSTENKIAPTPYDCFMKRNDCTNEKLSYENKIINESIENDLLLTEDTFMEDDLLLTEEDLLAESIIDDQTLVEVDNGSVTNKLNKSSPTPVEQNLEDETIEDTQSYAEGIVIEPTVDTLNIEVCPVETNQIDSYEELDTEKIIDESLQSELQYTEEEVVDESITDGQIFIQGNKSSDEQKLTDEFIINEQRHTEEILIELTVDKETRIVNNCSLKGKPEKKDVLINDFVLTENLLTESIVNGQILIADNNCPLKKKLIERTVVETKEDKQADVFNDCSAGTNTTASNELPSLEKLIDHSIEDNEDDKCSVVDASTHLTTQQKLTDTSDKDKQMDTEEKLIESTSSEKTSGANDFSDKTNNTLMSSENLSDKSVEDLILTDSIVNGEIIIADDICSVKEKLIDNSLMLIKNKHTDESIEDKQTHAEEIMVESKIDKQMQVANDCSTEPNAAVINKLSSIEKSIYQIIENIENALFTKKGNLTESDAAEQVFVKDNKLPVEEKSIQLSQEQKLADESNKGEQMLDNQSIDGKKTHIDEALIVLTADKQTVYDPATDKKLICESINNDSSLSTEKLSVVSTEVNQGLTNDNDCSEIEENAQSPSEKKLATKLVTNELFEERLAESYEDNPLYSEEKIGISIIDDQKVNNGIIENRSSKETNESNRVLLKNDEIIIDAHSEGEDNSDNKSIEGFLSDEINVNKSECSLDINKISKQMTDETEIVHKLGDVVQQVKEGSSLRESEEFNEGLSSYSDDVPDLLHIYDDSDDEVVILEEKYPALENLPPPPKLFPRPVHNLDAEELKQTLDSLEYPLPPPPKMKKIVYDNIFSLPPTEFVAVEHNHTLDSLEQSLPPPPKIKKITYNQIFPRPIHELVAEKYNQAPDSFEQPLSPKPKKKKKTYNMIFPRPIHELVAEKHNHTSDSFEQSLPSPPKMKKITYDNSILRPIHEFVTEEQNLTSDPFQQPIPPPPKIKKITYNKSILRPTYESVTEERNLTSDCFEQSIPPPSKINKIVYNKSILRPTYESVAEEQNLTSNSFEQPIPPPPNGIIYNKSILRPPYQLFAEEHNYTSDTFAQPLPSKPKKKKLTVSLRTGNIIKSKCRPNLMRKSSQRPPEKLSSAHYICPKCSGIYLGLYRLNQHMNVCGVPSGMKCKFCPRRFTCKRSLLEHLKKIHDQWVENEVTPEISDDIVRTRRRNGKTYLVISKKHLRMIRVPDFITVYCYRCHIEYISLPENNKRKCDKCGLGLHFHCKKCNHRFISCTHIDIHKEGICLEKKPLRCEHCNYKADTHENLIRHEDEQHKDAVHDSPDFYCSYLCGRKFKCRESMIRHEKYCGQEPHLKCSYCSFKTKYTSAIRMHVQQHILVDDRTFTAADSTSDEVVEVTESTSKEPVVDVDSKDVEKEQFDKIRKYIVGCCPKCEAITEIPDVIINKCWTCFTPLVYKCRICWDAKNTYYQVRIHVTRCHGEKIYTCTKCSKKYSYSSDMKKHMKTCCVEPTIECKVCRFRTHHEASLSLHMRRKHPATARPQYHCTKCLTKFTTKESMIRHVRCYCGKPANLQCEHCDFKTKSKFSLKRHLQSIHVKLFIDSALSCRICKKEFSNAFSYETHIRWCHVQFTIL